MLKQRKYILGWTLIALAVLIVGLSVPHSSAFQQCIATDSQSKSNQPQKEGPSYIFMPRAFRCVGTFLDANGSAIAALGALIVAWFTFAPWRSTDKLWDVTRITANMAEKQVHAARDNIKAWVFAGPRLTSWHPKDGVVRVTIKVVNYGQTLGLVTKLCVDSGANLPRGDPRLYAYRHDPTEHSYPIGHGENWEDVIFPFPQEDRFIFGYVEYLDVLGRTYVARFRGELDRETARYFPAGSPDWNDLGTKKVNEKKGEKNAGLYRPPWGTASQSVK